MSSRPFGVAETHGILALPSADIRASSDGLDWRSIYLSSQREDPFKGSFIAKDPLLVFHRRPVVGYVDKPRKDLVHAPSGSVRFVAAGTPFDVELSETTETVHMYIRQEVWDDVAIDVADGNASRAAFSSRLISADPLLSSLCDAGLAAVQVGDTGPAFSDHLSRCIASHIMSAHLGIRPTRRASETGRIISPEVTRAIEFIETHADRSIGLQEIASAAGRSPSHLARVFGAEVGMPPHRYLISVRIKRARQLLARTTRPIAEIALDCGFTHQEHLTRMFRRHFQTTPAAYRRTERSGAPG